MSDFNTPKELLNAYRSGLKGSVCDPEETAELLASLKTPLFGATAYGLFGSGEGKLSLPFRSLLKFDPGFGPAERQTTGDCFAAGTIVTSNLCKTIENVKVGDEIFSPDGGKTTVISKSEKQSFKPLVKIKTLGSLPLTVTEDHKLFVGRIVEKGDESSDKSHVATISKVYGSRVSKRSVSKQWINAGDVKRGDYLISPVDIQKSKRPENRFIDRKDFDWFLGYFLGDGWCDEKSLEITFTKHQTEHYNKCERFLSSFGFNVRKCDYKSKSTTAFRLRCWCPELAQWLRHNFYDPEKNKLFPSWAIGCRDTVAGLIDSDGFRSGNDKETFDSKSKSLSYGIYYSYLKMGYKPTINKFHRAEKGNFKPSSESLRVVCIFNKKKNYSFIDNGLLYIQVSGTESFEGPHTVYDIGVDHKDHAFLANGVIAHNCVSHATRNAVDITRAVEIDIKGEAESFEARSATEGIYQSRSHRGQGMTCSGAAKYVATQGGILLRKDYGEIDLSTYNSSIGANKKIPRSIWIDEANKHQVKTISMITTVEEARDALANGYAISVCSGYGFSSRRDAKGIAKRSGGWNHAMAWIACDDTHERFNETLFLIQNSWGIWNNGPKVHGQPEGSFWIREKDARGMLASQGSWVFSDVGGFPARDLPNYGTTSYL